MISTYRILQALPVLDQDFLDAMSTIVDSLDDIRTLVVDTADRVAEFEACQLLAENEALLSNIISAVRNIDKVGKASEMAGSVTSAIGKTKIAGRVGLWGFAGIALTSGILERVGNHLEALGNRLTPIAEKLQRKLQYCVLTVNQTHILETINANQQQAVQFQQEILAAIRGNSDLNFDGRTDLDDFALFQQRFGEPQP